MKNILTLLLVIITLTSCSTDPQIGEFVAERIPHTYKVVPIFGKIDYIIGSVKTIKPFEQVQLIKGGRIDTDMTSIANGWVFYPQNGIITDYYGYSFASGSHFIENTPITAPGYNNFQQNGEVEFVAYTGDEIDITLTSNSETIAKIYKDGQIIEDINIDDGNVWMFTYRYNVN